MIVPGRVFAPFKSCPGGLSQGGMVLDEIDTCIIGSQKFFIEANVVKNELPLLLSRQPLKRAETITDFSNDTVNVGGRDIIKLTCTSSGHYCLPLTRLLLHDSSPHSRIVLHAVNLKTMTIDEKRRKAAKLHRQFSHASKEKLIRQE